MSGIIVASGRVIVKEIERLCEYSNCVLEKSVLLNLHGATDYYKFCGGKVENADKSLIEAASREVNEEMGFYPKIIDPKPFIFFIREENSGQSTDIILVHFLAEQTGKIKPGKDILKWGYQYLNDLPDKLAPNIVPALTYFGFLK